MAPQKLPPVEEPAMEALIGRGLTVAGPTYDVRSELFRAGCRWYAFRRCWVAASSSVLARAQKIVEDGEKRKSTEDFDLRGIPTQALVREVINRNVDLSVSTLGDAVAGWPPTVDEFMAELGESFDFTEFDSSRPQGGEGEEA